MKKEYKTFAFKATLGDEPGRFAGKASVYGNVDFYGDVVMRGAFDKSLEALGNRVVILSQHKPEHSIGIAELEDRSDALYIKRGELELGIKQAEEDYLRLKRGIISGISIGYEAVRDRRRTDGGRDLLEINLWEVSLVTFPANTLARVDDVKDASALSDLIVSMRETHISERERRDIEQAVAALRAIRKSAERDAPMFFKALGARS